jgi:DUF1680 family protein
MSLADHDSVYADAVETAMYNGVMSSISLDGKSFFYCNPLEIQTRLLTRNASSTRSEWLPEARRREVFGCSCCPPNITRFIGSVGDRIYSPDQNTIYVNHYIASKTNTLLDGQILILTQKTAYPFDGKVRLTCEYTGTVTLAFRIPGWCAKYTVKVNGKALSLPVKKGYAFLETSGKTSVELNFKMDVCLIEANPNVQDDSGRCAVRRGPVVYCAESADNGGLLRDLQINAKAKTSVIPDPYFGAPVLLMKGRRRKESDLYRALPSRQNRLHPLRNQTNPLFHYCQPRGMRHAGLA